MRKKSIVIALVVFVLTGSANSAYAQFWKKWFNKDEQAQKSVPAKKADAPEPQVKNSKATKPQAGEKKIKELPYNEAENIVEKQLAKDSQEARSAMAGVTAAKAMEIPSQDVIDRAKYDAANNTTPIKGVPENVDKSEKEEQLRQTQERVDQIRKTNESNNAQNSMDQIRRINELNKQQKRVNDINKFNQQQKKLDGLNELNRAKK